MDNMNFYEVLASINGEKILRNYIYTSSNEMAVKVFIDTYGDKLKGYYIESKAFTPSPNKVYQILLLR